MTLPEDVRNVLEDAAAHYPFPIAAACRRFLDAPPRDPWHEWERLSRDLLSPILQYLSHLLLSDLVAAGHQPPHLFHRIQALLSRPLAGHYVGFLRETARDYREAQLSSAIPELVDFLLAAEVDATLFPDGQPLLGLLVDYRNLWAHGRFDNPRALATTVAEIRGLTVTLLRHLSFLTRYPLHLADGQSLMGSRLDAVEREARPLLVIAAGGLTLRPLLLKLQGRDVVLLEEFDPSSMRVAYRGSRTYHRFTRKQLARGDAARLVEDLSALVHRVRALDALLPAPDWPSFRDRAAVVTDRTLALYTDMRKYVPPWFVPRPAWEGEQSVFSRFLASDRTLLALSGPQGSGKSALAAHLADQCRRQGHAVLFLNAQRFSFADVAWAGSPYPAYFARLLHYDADFERTAVARILASAPPGTQVILFLDAINEVDGLTTKWNRFRAMELLLEWIVGLAQPRLKVILSFRLDAYEEFGYLEPDELPVTLPDICWPGNNPRKPWVTDLEPFDETQAQALYAKLQAQPQYGMAPAMSWEQLTTGLGERLPAFTANPLLFGIFLRAHHQERAVHTADPDQLFLRDAGKLTGSLEAAAASWWRKTWRFLQNGNITPKEQFLADLVSKVAETGAPAFLVEHLQPRKNKRDRRLAAVLHDPHAPTFPALKDGGLLAEERIELEKNGQPVVSRRVTFVAELLVAALEEALHKRRRLAELRESLFFLACLWILPPILVTVATLLGWHYVARPLLLPQHAPEILVRTVTQHLLAFIAAMLLELIPLVFLLSVYIPLVGFLALRSHSPVSATGLLQAAFLSQSGIPVHKIFLPLFATAFAWALAAATIELFRPNTFSPLIALAPLLGVALFACLAFVPGVMIYWHRIFGFRAPLRLVISAHKTLLRYLSSPSAGVYRTRIELAVSALLLAGLAYLIYSMQLSPSLGASTRLPIAHSSVEAAIYRFLHANLAAAPLDFHHRYQPIFLGLLLVAMFLVTLGLTRYAPYLGRQLCMTFGDPSKVNVAGRRHPLMICLFLGYSLASVLLLSSVAYELLVSGADDLSLIDSFGLPADAYSLDTFGRVTSLDLSSSPDPRRVPEPHRYQSLTRLILPRQPGLVVDVARLPALRELAAPLAFVRNLDRSDVARLTLYDPCVVPNRPVSISVVHLTLQARCHSLRNLAQAFPSLVELEIDERLADTIARAQPPLWNNLRLVVQTPSPPRLAWLTSHHSRYIIVLTSAPNELTNNLNILERLWLPALGLDPAVLRNARSLRWLRFAGGASQSSEWYKELSEILKTSLPNLIALEFALHHGSPFPLAVAYGKDEALTLLRSLAQDPTLLLRGRGAQRRPA